MSQNTMTAAIVGEPEVLEDESGIEITSELIALADGVESDPAWLRLKESATKLQSLQVKDGSVPEEGDKPAASALVDAIVESVEALAPRFPHEAAYLRALQADFRKWQAEGLGEPDFLDSLIEFQPQLHRVQGQFAVHGPVAADITGLAQLFAFAQVAGDGVGGGQAFAGLQGRAAGAQFGAERGARRIQRSSSTMPMRTKRP